MMNSKQRRVLQVMHEQGISGLSIELAPKSRVALDHILPTTRPVFLWTEDDIRSNTFATTFMLRILRHGTTWVPRSERFYQPVGRPKPL
jgi:hypothetical protein